MEIKQYKSFQFNRLNNNYQVLNYAYFESPISHVISCLESCYYYVLRYGGPVKFVLFLDDIGIGFNELDISVDSKNDLIYTSEQFFAENYEHCMTKEEFDIKSENMTNLELYQHDFLTHAVMTKNNFIDLLTQYDFCIKNKVPFFVLSFDGNIYDIVTFDTQENMNQFIKSI